MVDIYLWVQSSNSLDIRPQRELIDAVLTNWLVQSMVHLIILPNIWPNPTQTGLKKNPNQAQYHPGLFRSGP